LKAGEVAGVPGPEEEPEVACRNAVALAGQPGGEGRKVVVAGSTLEDAMTDGEIGIGQSAAYLSVARAYRDAYLAGACEKGCWPEAVRAVQCLHPFLSNKEAERLARRIVSQFLQLYPGWLAT
jgi:hypothetical protein